MSAGAGNGARRVLVTGGSGFIGTNLIDALEAAGVRLVNVDVEAPRESRHAAHWIRCDILDRPELARIFVAERPSEVIHLAARTDVDGRTLADYRANIEGTANVLDAVARAGSAARLIVASTQFVHQFQGAPAGDEDFAPYTVYGQSKVETERLTRAAGLACAWTIVRPTNIWGPWHPRYPREFWRVLASGRYAHPGRQPVLRSYGYVGNVVWQLLRFLALPPDAVAGRVFYVGDRPVNLLDWANGFSRAQTGRDVRIVPRPLVRSLALVGDTLKMAKVPFPITTSRYRNMITGNPADMEATFALLGDAPFTLDAGIAATVEWMRAHHPALVRV